MDEVLQCTQEPKNEREMVLVFHRNAYSLVSARLIAPGSRLDGFGPLPRIASVTLAMAAGVTDRVWSLKEVLLFRVPPWPQAQAV
jgi:hypothetical protein